MLHSPMQHTLVHGELVNRVTKPDRREFCEPESAFDYFKRGESWNFLSLENTRFGAGPLQ